VSEVDKDPTLGPIFRVAALHHLSRIEVGCGGCADDGAARTGASGRERLTPGL